MIEKIKRVEYLQWLWLIFLSICLFLFLFHQYSLFYVDNILNYHIYKKSCIDIQNDYKNYNLFNNNIKKWKNWLWLSWLDLDL